MNNQVHNNRFVLPAKLNTLLLSMIGIGVLCMILSYIWGGEHHERFWSNLLLNASFFTLVSFLALFFYCANIIALSGWYTQFKRVWEAYMAFLLPGLILMAFIGVSSMMDWSILYHWADPNSVASDKVLEGKSPFLNYKWYFLTIIGFGGVWYLVSRLLRSLSQEEDMHGTMDYKYHKRMQIYAAFLLIFGGFTSAAAVWLWIMSVDAHWYSTLFAWYTCVSALVTMIALTILTLIYLKSKGYYSHVTKEHLHDLGKYLFAFSIFWAYMWFSQYMLIWYANVGEETIYYRHRLDNYRVLFFGNLLINFALPFLVLLRNDTKRKYGTLIFVSIMLIFGHWLDYFLMIKPGVLHTVHEVGGHGHGEHIIDAHGANAHHVVEQVVGGFAMPGLIEIGTFIGFLGLFLLVSFNSLRRAQLEPRKDPYYEESLHHHV